MQADPVQPPEERPRGRFRVAGVPPVSKRERNSLFPE